MYDAGLPAFAARLLPARAPAYIGPLIPAEHWLLRFAAAIAVVAVTVALRASLSPLLGTQAPLLPFVLAVFVSAYLGGRGPGLVACALTPIAATFWFTTWPHDAPPGQWAAHVVFFLLIGGLATLLMHELQRSAHNQRLALEAAAANADHARASASQLRLIADSMPALISYVGPDGVYRFTNKLYENWFGVPAGEVEGRHLRDVLGKDAYEMVRPRLERALRGERVFFEAEIPYVRGTREVAVHYIPDSSSDGKIRGCFALVEDISPRKRAERSLREADRRKDDFLAILAHELRNPLTPIRNVAHILSRGQPDVPTVRRSGEMLERQATLLTQLVDDLLDVARITRGRIVLRREALSLAPLVESTLESLRPVLEARQQSVQLLAAGPDLFLDADPVRLSQVITNLLTNASRYSPEGSKIELAIEAERDEVVFSVRDEGIGIDPLLLPQIFDSFLQGDRSLDRSQGGLGIGLTIVRHLVEMHGGRVVAESAGLGQGSEFRVYLPRAEAPQAARPGSDVGRPRAFPKRRVLVVDDNRDAAESLRELLRMHGHDVEVVNDGAAALGALEEFRADLVILDLGLPRVDGYMVAHAIRARFAQSKRRPGLLALTGHGRAEDRLAALRSGFDGHLVKPVEPERLLRVVAEEGQRANVGELI
jgi:two-component system CheB/CheR fusion protein